MEGAAPDRGLLRAALLGAGRRVGQAGGVQQRQSRDPLRGDAQDLLRHVAAQREAGQRERRRRGRQHLLRHRVQALALGQVADLAVGQVGQRLQLRMPQLGIVEQAGQQQQRLARAHALVGRRMSNIASGPTRT